MLTNVNEVVNTSLLSRIFIDYEVSTSRKFPLFNRIHFNEIGSSARTVNIDVTLPVYEVDVG